MKKALLALCSLLIFVSVSFAAKPATPSFGTLSMLKGTYGMQSRDEHFQTWGVNKTCPTSATITTTTYVDPVTGLIVTTTTHVDNAWQNYQSGGSDIISEFNYGTIAFDGAGNWTGTITDLHAFDYNATVAQYTVTCGTLNSDGTYTPPIITNGPVKFLAPSIMSVSGTYSIGTDGTGAILLTSGGGGGGGGMYLEIGGPPTVSTGPWTTILFIESGTASNPCTDCGSGTAVLQ